MEGGGGGRGLCLGNWGTQNSRCGGMCVCVCGGVCCTRARVKLKKSEGRR